MNSNMIILSKDWSYKMSGKYQVLLYKDNLSDILYDPYKKIQLGTNAKFELALYLYVAQT